MAITYESGNVGDNATDANATSMNITIGGTLTSSDVFFAVLTGWSTGSDFTSITQTNVTWTYLTDWVNSTNNCEIELWVGFATGTPGTTITVHNNVSCFLVGTISRWQGFVSQPNMIRDRLADNPDRAQATGLESVGQLLQGELHVPKH